LWVSRAGWGGAKATKGKSKEGAGKRAKPFHESKPGEKGFSSQGVGGHEKFILEGLILNCNTHVFFSPHVTISPNIQYSE